MGPRLVLFLCVLSTLLGCARPSDGPDHLLLVVFDTLRPDRMSVNGYSLETTPFLVETRQEFLRFADVVSPGPWTVPAHSSLFTGLQPSDHQAQWGNMFLAEETETLAEILADEGFCTVGLSANPLVSNRTGLDQGFQDFEVIKGSWPQRSATLLDRFSSALGLARERDCRLFSFLNFMDTHIPYNSSRHGESFGVDGSGPVDSAKIKWRISAGLRPFPGEEKRQHGAAYDAAVRRIDDLVKDIFALLQQAGVLEETLVVLTSDHGDGLGVHPEIGHSISVWQEQLRVPLLVRIPGGRHGGEVVTERTSLTAVLPTLLDWLGVDRPGALSAAADLWQASQLPVTAEYRSYFGTLNRKANARTAARYPELAERNHHTHVLFCQQFKLMVDATGKRRFFDLLADPGEQRDLAAEGMAAMDACWERYRNLLGQGRFTPFSYEPPDQAKHADSEPDLEALETLGYIQ